MKRALITGITGQDAAYLAQFLLGKGYKVFGTYRRLSTPNFWRLNEQGIYNKINLIPADLMDMSSLFEAVRISDPDEVYHLAAQSFVEASFEQPITTANVSGVSVNTLLEVLRLLKPDAAFYQASSSEIFGNSDKILNENSPFHPASPYAAAKAYGYYITKIYRKAYNMRTFNGILFNHESPLRGLEFVTRKISNGVAKISLGIEDKLHLGNLEAKRDWGYAPEYAYSMWLMLQHDTPDDFVIATGRSHSVKEFVQLAFESAGIDNWEKYVEVSKRFKRPYDVEYLNGDSTKAREKLGWKSNVHFQELVKLMVAEDIRRWSDWQNGKVFPWDAPNYPGENGIITRA